MTSSAHTEPTISDHIPSKTPTFRVINTSKDGAVLAGYVEWAGTSQERRRGLMGRTELDRDHAMYIVPCEGIHTFGMKFSIDVAFLDANKRIIALHHALKPRRISKIVFRAEGVLELAAGKLRETDTGIGDVIEFRENDTES
jgi:uncharacterized protein